MPKKLSLSDLAKCSELEQRKRLTEVIRRARALPTTEPDEEEEQSLLFRAGLEGRQSRVAR